jgi:hypothetical protein
MLFNSARVMSTPCAVPGLVVPVVGSTVKPIGFKLVGLFGSRPLLTFEKFELKEKGMPAVL